MADFPEQNELNGGVIPSDSVQDLSNVEGAPPTGFFTGFGTAVKAGFEQGPTSQLGSIFKAVPNLNSPPQHLTSQQFKDSQWARPGLNFPNGTTKSIAEEAASRHDRQAQNRIILDNMKPGFISDTAKITGGLTGFLMDPVNLAVGMGGGEAIDALQIARFLPDTLETSRAGRAAKGIARGAAEGAIFQTPGSLSRFSANNEFGEKTTILPTLKSIGEGAALGGMLRGLHGLVRPVDPSALEGAQQNAINQLAGDKSVNVMPTIDEGYSKEIDRTITAIRAARRAEKNSDADIITRINSDDQNKLEDQNKIIKNNEAHLSDVSKKNPMEIRPRLSTQSLVKRLIKTTKIPEENRTSSQQLFMDQHQSLETIQKKALNIGIRPEEAQGADIKKINPTEELTELNNRISQSKSRISTLKKDSEDESLPQMSRDHANQQLEIENHNLSMAENRKLILEKKPSLHPKVLDAKIRLHREKLIGHDLISKINESEMVESMIAKGPTPLTKEQIEAASSIMNSADGNIFIDAGVLRIQAEKVARTPTDSEAAIDKNFETMQNEKDDPEIAQILEDHRKAEKETDRSDAGLQKVTNCIIGKFK